jgi:hypothetical protein
MKITEIRKVISLKQESLEKLTYAYASCPTDMILGAIREVTQDLEQLMSEYRRLAERRRRQRRTPTPEED